MNVIVKVTLGEILNAPYWKSWDHFCSKYGINEWCINEGLASGNEIYDIEYEDALLYGLVEQN